LGFVLKLPTAEAYYRDGKAQRAADMLGHVVEVEGPEKTALTE
jgi:hypothetical protein